MNSETLPKAYEAKDIETEIYKQWEKGGYFEPKRSSGAPFVISLPPPNATGTLHIGHAMMLAVEDLMIRYHRLRGDETLWLPGTDHAAIATQNVVEKKIWAEEKKDRHQIGREELLKKIQQFVEGSRATIRSQLRRMGSSLDWSRERFTLDEGLSRVVRMVFKMMYDDGLIYRGDRIVNWCTRCQTTLADDEVEYTEKTTPFYHFKFGPFSIGTVRPETKLGDKYVVVHPDDKRYKKYHGMKKMIPWIDGEVEMTVIADESAEIETGSGAMTITPAHSFVDFETAQKHGLEIKGNIIGTDGKLTENAGKFAGISVREAREKFVQILQEKGLVEKIDEDYKHNLSVCYRCDTPVEPLISKQWFVNVNKPVKRLGGKTLRERAIEAVKNGEIKIIPERFTKIYLHWMDNLHDWCISRQIWYGHQMPVWYRHKSETDGIEIYVGVDAPDGEGWEQDPDTLDTWFSSGLWTFSTLLKQDAVAADIDSWRKVSPDLKYHPTSVLETAYDIFFFWVARMILMTTYAMNEVPFKNVYLHGLVRDEKGRKMSKSLGNVIDPVDMIDKYGADPVRLSLVIGIAPGNDSRLNEEKIAGYRNFVNKLWNISRYILMNTKPTTDKPEPKTMADKWIMSEFNELKTSVTNHIENYRFSAAGEELYEFTWSKLADWYVEFAKEEGGGKDAILRSILRELLIMWHPYTPYVTEHIWGKLDEKEMLIVQAWPKVQKVDPSEDFKPVLQAITAAREMKQALGLKNNENLDTPIFTNNRKPFGDLKIISGISGTTFSFADSIPNNVTKRVLDQATVYTTVSPSQERIAQAAKETSELEKYIATLRARLADTDFRSRAPAAIINKEEERLKEAEERLKKLKL